MKRDKIKTNKRAAGDRSVNNPGLCATCRNESACTYVRPDDIAVIFCEEFDTTREELNPVRPDARSVLQRVAAAVESEKAALIAPKRLCINCATSGECVYSHSGDNRWYCEEYS